MKAIWKGEDDELGLRAGKTYEILSVEWDGEMYNVIDETGEDFLYPSEDFEIIKETEVITAAEIELIDFIEEYLETDAEDVMYFWVPGEADDE